MRKVSIVEMTLVVDTPEEVNAVKSVLGAKNISYKTDCWGEIKIIEQLSIEEYADIVHQIENAL